MGSKRLIHELFTWTLKWTFHQSTPVLQVLGRSRPAPSVEQNIRGAPVFGHSQFDLDH